VALDGPASRLTLIDMLTKPLLLAIIAACGVSNSATQPEGPGDLEPPEADKPAEDQHFCCKSVDLKNASGEDCFTLPKDGKLIDLCAEVLYCSGDWGKSNGVTQCLK
jgi:hypothetical protein